jgi:hypothetical protein
LAIGDQASFASLGSPPDTSVLAMTISKQSSKHSIGAGVDDQCEDGEDGLSSVIEMARSTLANKAKRTSPKRKTAGPLAATKPRLEVPIDDADVTSGSESNIEDEGEQTHEAHVANKAVAVQVGAAIVQKKPIATTALKKPAAAPLSATPPTASPSSASAGEKPPPSFEPTHCTSGKIDFSPKKFPYRVYRRKIDRIEKTVKVYDVKNTKVVKKAWAQCLKLVDDDPRPM